MQSNFQQKGVSLIVTFFVMVILLGVHLSISTVLYSEIKILKNIGASLVSFFLADSGTEKVLFYNARGLCKICSDEEFENACREDANPNTPAFDKSIYCNQCQLQETAANGCNYEECGKCKISFGTDFDEKRKYQVSIETAPTPTGSIFTTIDSTGYYNNSVLRAVKISLKEDKDWECGQTLVDSRDGQAYATIQIKTQCWMRENLNIGTMKSGFQSQSTTCDNIIKHCWHDQKSNCDALGALYQWSQAMCGSSSPGAKGICPEGWHIPTHAEWTTLERAICTSGDLCTSAFPNNTTSRGSFGTNEGYIMRLLEPGTFSALATGKFSIAPTYRDFRYGDSAFFWSSTQQGANYAWIRYLTANASKVSRDYFIDGYYFGKTDSLSVRCIKD